MMRDFPTEHQTVMGQFWMADKDAGQSVVGVLRIEGEHVGLEVSPELTPYMEYRPNPNGGGLIGEPSKEPAPFAVVGTISMLPGDVTLWGMRTVGRRSVGLWDDGARTSHKLQANWCLVGGHAPDQDVKFFGVRIDLTNLAEWAWIPLVDQSRDYDNGRRLRKATWNFRPKDGCEIELAEGAGYLEIVPAATFSPLTIRGFNVITKTGLEVELIDGWMLGEVFERFTIPMTSLMTILTGTRCGLRNLSVWTEDTDWLDVHGVYLEPGSPETVEGLLLTREDTGPQLLSHWLDLHERVSPVPQILAAAVSGEFNTIEAKALSLATAIEGLHRVLYPNAVRFDSDQIAKSVDALAVSNMPEPVRKSFHDALTSWWKEKSYPQRVAEIAEPVGDVVPQCIGKLNRWKTAVADQRISLAHGKNDRTDILRMSSLSLSIQWMLVIRLLLEAGVGPETVKTAIDRSERFRRECQRWQRDWPRVFGEPEAKRE